ncbi:MAG: hypothetical protein KKC46_01935 [Proteobacteria bacterium]|nr:hypothetical protein [Pseudomonadota bacterium]
MKNQSNRHNNSILFLKLFTSIGLITLGVSGCTSGSSIIASTGTVIGVEISQNPATQNPTASLGYKRAELAYVPTNRATSNKTVRTENSDGTITTTTKEGIPDLKDGARDSANVIMELKYFGIFSWGDESGIYQRLAVGDKAVSEPGAALLFSKDSSGKVDQNIAKSVARAETLNAVEDYKISKISEYVSDGSGSINNSTLSALLLKAKTKFPTIVTTTVEITINKCKKNSDLTELLSEDLNSAINPLYISLPANNL